MSYRKLLVMSINPEQDVSCLLVWKLQRMRLRSEVTSISRVLHSEESVRLMCDFLVAL